MTAERQPAVGNGLTEGAIISHLNTRAENELKCGAQIEGRFPGLNFGAAYWRDNPFIDGDKDSEKPYYTVMMSRDGAFTNLFKDAPNPGENVTTSSAAEELRAKGYDVTTGESFSMGGYLKTNVDRFDIYISYAFYEDGQAEIRIYQEVDEDTVADVNRLISSPSSAG